jgi:hypothetical protein
MKHDLIKEKRNSGREQRKRERQREREKLNVLPSL